MTYSYKTILFISTTAVSSTVYSFFLFPSASTELFDMGLVTSLLALSAPLSAIATQASSSLSLSHAPQASLGSGLAFSDDVAHLLLLTKEFTLGSFTNSIPFFEMFFLTLNFLAVVFFLDLVINLFISNVKSFFWFKPFNFLKTSFFLSYTFMTSIDTLLAFVYFFFFIILFRATLLFCILFKH